jgi:hypothetical protein
MRATLFYTTMANHRPVYNVGGSAKPDEKESPPREFRATAARDPTVQNTNPPALRDFLARSTQPIFSVSTIFRMKSGGGCGSCGH